MSLKLLFNYFLTTKLTTALRRLQADVNNQQYSWHVLLNKQGSFVTGVLSTAAATDI